jgi:hypothetical protein
MKSHMQSHSPAIGRSKRQQCLTSPTHGDKLPVSALVGNQIVQIVQIVRFSAEIFAPSGFAFAGLASDTAFNPAWRMTATGTRTEKLRQVTRDPGVWKSFVVAPFRFTRRCIRSRASNTQSDRWRRKVTTPVWSEYSAKAQNSPERPQYGNPSHKR